MKATESDEFRSILGIDVFVGDAIQAVGRMMNGGLLIMPAAPALTKLPHDAGYREAVLAADLVIADSSFMVMIWNYLEHDSIRRLSGLEYLSALLTHHSFCAPNKSFWIMASSESAKTNSTWLRQEGIDVTAGDIYTAPTYGESVVDPVLLEQIREKRPRHIMVTIGGGTQERLGLYLRQALDHSPAIHCVGAAIAFLSGDQVRIPAWTDRLYLGWVLRCLSNPKEYLPRYWDARKLLTLMVKYRSNLPDVA